VQGFLLAICLIPDHARFQSMQHSRLRLIAVSVAAIIYDVSARVARWFEKTPPPTVGDANKIVLQDGDALLAIIKDGKVLFHTPNIALSHAEFVRRSTGTLPVGAWIGTIRKFGGSLFVLNSKTFYGNQLPPSQPIIDAVRTLFC
jgi:hypothetical protein